MHSTPSLPNCFAVPAKKIICYLRFVAHPDQRRIHYLHHRARNDALITQLAHRTDTQDVEHHSNPRNPHPPQHTAPMPRLLSTVILFFFHFEIHRDCRRRRLPRHSPFWATVVRRLKLRLPSKSQLVKFEIPSAHFTPQRSSTYKSRKCPRTRHFLHTWNSGTYTRWMRTGLTAPFCASLHIGPTLST
jgi:hypothetical protein